ncbi:unnamed protein product [Schistosoma mattheei]|uniref:Uncharacterized protein n=1 Tax=Schistosoma mattheei TaxID=31246 RepID=A0A183Q0S4_9TREM|nr:unnamed protein product [Schistosoma mattheei]
MTSLMYRAMRSVRVMRKIPSATLNPSTVGDAPRYQRKNLSECSRLRIQAGALSFSFSIIKNCEVMSMRVK